ncbi:hypothetical protein BD94_0235 [Elizabethkingia anophelis NUHP1]|uniref:Uncharacterized protein n=1 Tax=Elizabethkingia anophelis NUHP1 TaxID=1338011 RepID=A0A077EEX0_9FLAO|nr:hypothetical protein BD94_0235 [Elizabethkingia anophelis NUHP1]
MSLMNKSIVNNSLIEFIQAPKIKIVRHQKFFDAFFIDA